jgi:hypothetical protein
MIIWKIKNSLDFHLASMKSYNTDAKIPNKFFFVIIFYYLRYFKLIF